MRSPLVSLLLILFALSTAQAVERVDAKRWRGVKTYSMAELKQLDPLPMRKIVGLRFAYRHRTVRHLKPSWYQGSLWVSRHDNVKADYDYVQVMVAKNDLAAFKALPSDPGSEERHLVYGQVLRDSESGFTFLRLLGTKVERDGSGNVVVDW